MDIDRAEEFFMVDLIEVTESNREADYDDGTPANVFFFEN